MRLKTIVTTLLLAMTGPVYAAPTPAQLCESAIELASAKHAQCRLNAESKFSKSNDAGKRTAALAKCTEKLTTAFAKAVGKYGAACAATEPSSAFDDYLKQCSDDAAAAAAGAALPDYVGDLSACNADLTACGVDLATCTTNLGSAEGDLSICEGDLAVCEALPVARLMKTGQTSCWDFLGGPIDCAFGTYHDGNQQTGVALPTYVDNGDGTMTDPNTGLMWEKLSDDGTIHDKDNTYTWAQSVDQRLQTLNSGGGFAGHTDWRAPNVRELASLLNYQNVNPATSPSFNDSCTPGCTVLTCSCTASEYYWTSSTYAPVSGFAWTLYFNDGAVGNAEKTFARRARAVRGGS